MKIQVTLIHEDATYFGEAELQPERAKKAAFKAPKSLEGPGKSATKPSEAVGLLYRRGFFNTARKLGDVSNELGGAGYNFSRQSVLFALKAAAFLALKGKRGSYAFVQKFPPQA